MAMFTAYFDASGHPDDKGKAKSLWVAGFVSTVQKWAKLEHAWPMLLKEYDIPSPLHMTDFIARQGRYRKWKGNKAAQEDFRCAAARILKLHIHKPFAAGVVIPDLRRMFDEYDVPETEPRQPYAWCALQVCDRLFEWAQNRVRAGVLRGSNQLEIVFEDGDKHQGDFAKAFWAKHRKAVNFRMNVDKAWVPFQACDFFGWEFRVWARDRIHGYFLLREADRSAPAKKRELRENVRDRKMIKPNPVVLEFVRQLPAHAVRYADWDVLSRECERLGWSKRAKQ